jgi:hypothetical protein
LGGVSKLIAKGLRTGFLDIVELRMAIVPIIQSIIKKALFARYILFKFTF